jgi:hypothetical protein
MFAKKKGLAYTKVGVLGEQHHYWNGQEIHTCFVIPSIDPMAAPIF